MAKASPLQAAFNAGELSPRLTGRVDLAKYGNGARLFENFLPTVQGPAVRRGGTRFVKEVKNSANRTWLLKFEFNTTQAYILEFGDGYIRFFANHGQVVVSGVAAYNGATPYSPGDLVSSGGVNYYCIAATTGNAPPNATYWYALTGSVYEVPSPYTAADLTTSDGELALRFVQSGDIIYIAHQSYPPKKLSRFGATNWTLTNVANTGGPFKPLNITTTTVYSGANTGSTTLTASANLFTASQVGSLIYVGEKDVRATVQWEAGKAYGAGAVVRSNGVNYQALNAATSGGVKPIHTEGAAYDGTTGVQWQYLDPGYGVATITGYTSPTQVSVTIQNRLPDGSVGSGNATTNFAFGDWNADDGYPSQVTFFRERLVFARDQLVWMSVIGDYENFSARDELGQVVSDQAIRITVVARKVNQIQWIDPGTDLIIGTAGGEFRCTELTSNEVFGPDNVTVKPQSEYGSRSIAPERIGPSVVYVQRSGRKVREMAYDYATDGYKSTDVTVLADHITIGGLVASDYQQEPYSVIWYARADGLLVGLTFNREQDVIGFHRHPLGGDGAVEAVACIPSPDTTRNELWLIVRRTINGQTKRYIEFMEVEHLCAGPGEPGADPEQAFYVDSGLSYDGAVNATLTPGTGATTAHLTGVNFQAGSGVFVPGDVGRSIHYRYLDEEMDEGYQLSFTWKTAKARITAYVDAQNVTCTIDAAFPDLSVLAASAWRMTVTTLTGLDHLEGQVVDVLAGGASHPQRTVTGGAITLQAANSYASVGLPCPCRLWTMRLNAGAQDGTSQGKTARINKLTIRFQETLGAQFGPDSQHLDELSFRSTGDLMDTPPPLFSGDKVVEFSADYTTDPWVLVTNNQPFPTVIVAIAPQVRVYDR